MNRIQFENSKPVSDTSDCTVSVNIESVVTCFAVLQCIQICSLFQTDEKKIINMKLKSVKQCGESETNKTVFLFACQGRLLLLLTEKRTRRENSFSTTRHGHFCD